jgi:hypothetical protein
MLRFNRTKVAAFVAVLFPAFADCDVETLIIGIGGKQTGLDTVTIRAEHGKLPEIDDPDGRKWTEQEKDSAWTDNGVRHYAYYHSFAATLGSRQGFGRDYATVDDNGTGTPAYSAGVSFTFPGDTTLLYSWGPAVHMSQLSNAYPYRETEFLSGYPVHGMVGMRRSGGENLAEGQWAMLLTRRRERPASASEPIVLPGKETLRIQIGKDDQPVDTMVIWTQYDAPPAIADPYGRNWAGWDKDSAWSDEKGWNLRYSHTFLAMKGSHQGYGFDYIYLIDNPEYFMGSPHYTAELSFSFQGDSIQSFSWEPEHMADVPAAYPYDKSGFLTSNGGRYGELSRSDGKGNMNQAGGQWVRLLTREPGWIGYQPAALSRPSNPGARADRWLVNLVPGATLQVPPGAKALRILDVQGRIRFETRNLMEGSEVTLPRDVPQKALRIHWQSGPG